MYAPQSLYFVLFSSLLISIIVEAEPLTYIYCPAVVNMSISLPHDFVVVPLYMFCSHLSYAPSEINKYVWLVLTQ